MSNASWFYEKKKKKNKTKQNKTKHTHTHTPHTPTHTHTLTRKVMKGNQYVTENLLGENEIWYAADNYDDTCDTRAEEFLDFNFN